jgi:hypothetical protein
VTNQGVGRLVEIIDHLRADHDMGHEREHRYGGQQAGVELAEDGIGDAADAALGDQHQDDGGDAETGKNRHPGQQQGDQPGQDQESRQGAPSRFFRLSRFATATKASNAAPRTRNDCGIHIGTSRYPSERMPKFIEYSRVALALISSDTATTRTMALPHISAMR